MMEGEFTLPEIPEVSIEVLAIAARDGELGTLAYESIRSLAMAAMLTSSFNERTEEFIAVRSTQRYAIVAGHMRKVQQLLASVLRLASDEKHGSALDITAHHVQRTAIQGLWFLTASDSQIKAYAVNSTLRERNLMKKVLDHGTPSQVAVATDRLAEILKKAGLCDSDFEVPHDPIPSLKQMAESLQMKDQLMRVFELSANAVNSSHADVISFVDLHDGVFAPSQAPKGPKTLTLATVGMGVCVFCEKFAASFFNTDISKRQFTEYFEHFAEWLDRLTDKQVQTSIGTSEENDSPCEKTKSISTRLKDHKQVHKTLIPPLLRMPSVQMQSWTNDRFPEVFWAMLLLTGLGREDGLQVLRNVIQTFVDLGDSDGDPTFTGLSKLPESKRDSVFAAIFSHRDSRTILADMLNIRNFPGRQEWLRWLNGLEPSEEAWNNMARAVAEGLDHQSQGATDCRWLVVTSAAAAGMLHLRDKSDYQQLFEYPNFGDQRAVRPFIRSSEGALAGGPRTTDKAWIKDFWSDCYDRTGCIPSQSTIPRQPVRHTKVTTEQLSLFYRQAVNYYYNCIPGTGIEPKHDAVWGTTMYVLTIFGELVNSNAERVIGLVGVRTIAEAIINLKYLLKKDDEALWKAFRDYGIGQAKLSVLKMDEAGVDAPLYLPVRELKIIANEDRWSEFSTINVGDWSGENLRDRSTTADAKDIYDRFYLWPSSFSHSQWAAIRYTVFDTCLNPLHRLHRMPRVSSQVRTVRYDLDELLKALLDTLEAHYPSFGDLAHLVSESGESNQSHESHS